MELGEYAGSSDSSTTVAIFVGTEVAALAGNARIGAPAGGIEAHVGAAFGAALPPHATSKKAIRQMPAQRRDTPLIHPAFGGEERLLLPTY